MDVRALLWFAADGNGAARLGWALGRGCVEVAVFAAVVWAICRLLPRIPARVRFWMWWLCCVKGLVATGASLAGVAVPLPVALPSLAAPVLPAVAPRLVRPAVPLADAPEKSPLAVPKDAEQSEQEPVRPIAAFPAPASPSVPVATWLVLGYGAGVAAMLALTVAQAVRAGVLRRRAAPVADPDVLKTAHEIARAYGLRSCPLVLLSGAARSPVVIGAFHPALVLPRDFPLSVTRDGLRLALAHEMAHVRRRDLLLSLAPTALRAVFFFFPPAYLVCRELEQAREEACDEAALLTENGSGAEYGRLLLAVSHRATGGARMGVGGMAMAQVPFRHLKRRLLAIQRAGQPTPVWVRTVAAGLVGLLGLGTLPWGGLKVQADAAPTLSPLDALTEPPLPRYEIIPLGDLGDTYSGNYSDARDISDSGQIVGAASLRRGGGRGHGFVLTATGQAVDPSAGSEFGRSQAVGVSDSGLVVASAFNRWSRPRAFVWDGGRRYLETTRGYRYSEAAGINEQGQVAATATRGRTINGAMPMRAFVWQAGQVRTLPTLGGPFSRAHGINRSGWVAGKADLPRDPGGLGVTHACVWDASGQPRDLGTLAGGYNSAARAVSDRGAVVGFSEVEGGAVRAFRASVDRGAAPRELGTIGGYAHSAAWDVAETARGEIIVGAAMGQKDNETDSRAVLWQDGGRSVDLNRCIAPGSGWTLQVARAVNGRGEIVGQGTRDGRRHGFLLRPVGSE